MNYNISAKTKPEPGGFFIFHGICPKYKEHPKIQKYTNIILILILININYDNYNH